MLDLLSTPLPVSFFLSRSPWFSRPASTKSASGRKSSPMDDFFFLNLTACWRLYRSSILESSRPYFLDLPFSISSSLPSLATFFSRFSVGSGFHSSSTFFFSFLLVHCCALLHNIFDRTRDASETFFGWIGLLLRVILIATSSASSTAVLTEF